MGLAFKAKQQVRWYPGTPRHRDLRFCDLLLGASQSMTTRLEAETVKTRLQECRGEAPFPPAEHSQAAWVNAFGNRRMEGEWATQTVDKWFWYKTD